MEILKISTLLTPIADRVSRFLRAETGSAVVGYAVALPALMGVVGVGVDMGMMSMKHTRLQTAADHAAINAVKELNVANVSDATITSSADTVAKATLNDSRTVVEVAVAIDRKGDAIEVTLTEKWNPFFAHFIGAVVTPIVVDATAKLAGRTDLCVLALEPLEEKAIQMDKSAKMLAHKCAVYSNSSSVEGIRLDKNAEMKAALVCSVGGVKSKTGVIDPEATTDCPVIEDPLSARRPPDIGMCLETKLVIDSGSITLAPGNYCGGLKITGDANVTFSPGEYIISDGDFEISQSACVTGKDVAFYLQGETAKLNFLGDTTVAFSGAETGVMAGLLFFGDRSLKEVNRHRINSANANELTGTIYLPRGHLLVDPNTSVAQDSAYTAIIVHKLEVSEGPTLTLNSDYSDTNVPLPDGVSIGSQVVLAE